MELGTRFRKWDAGWTNWVLSNLILIYLHPSSIHLSIDLFFYPPILHYIYLYIYIYNINIFLHWYAYHWTSFWPNFAITWIYGDSRLQAHPHQLWSGRHWSVEFSLHRKFWCLGDYHQQRQDSAARLHERPTGFCEVTGRYGAGRMGGGTAEHGAASDDSECQLAAGDSKFKLMTSHWQ